VASISARHPNDSKISYEGRQDVDLRQVQVQSLVQVHLGVVRIQGRLEEMVEDVEMELDLDVDHILEEEVVRRILSFVGTEKSPCSKDCQHNTVEVWSLRRTN
jgi:hypothetical protein